MATAESLPRLRGAFRHILASLWQFHREASPVRFRGYEYVMAAKKRRKKSAKTGPWERPAPRRTRHTKRSSGDKATAKNRARKAGRPYPNLVDNMAVAAKKRRRKSRAG
jgi:hypothetical protein